jgi:phospholipid/cholesterol/gamma-HCH transport system substrate-binding protein
VLNAVVNTLAYNPKGKEEGYLFWLAWANHDRALLYGQQDAHGPVRRGQIFTSCSALPVLENLPNTNEALGVLIELLNAPRQTQVCPNNPIAPTASSAKKKAAATP